MPSTISAKFLVLIQKGSSGLDIFIVSRSEEYLVNIPRPTLITRQHLSAESADAHLVGLAPAYEEPPTYEECVRNGLV